jgi:predicted SAM-dependent methyltransferase
MVFDVAPPENGILQKIGKLILNRYSLAFFYLGGKGIEIGALHNPLKVSPRTRVRYVDRMTVADLRRQYVELKDKKLVMVDVVDDGERLATFENGSQDFVIANHFLEHCQNPLLALENALRVLRRGGVLYLALPDKRYTFDRNRPVTALEHLIRDYHEGPERSCRGHFEEWVRIVNGVTDDLQAAGQVEHLMAMEYSIHYHCWTQREMMEMLLHLRSKFPFDLEVMLKRKDGVIFIIRKLED